MRQVVRTGGDAHFLGVDAGRRPDDCTTEAPYRRSMGSQAPLGSHLTPRLEHAGAGDVMRPWALTCTRETPLITAAQRMAAEHVHALVVLEPRGDGAVERYPWAVVTDRELLRDAERADELTAGAGREGTLTRLRWRSIDPLSGMPW